MYSLSRTAVIIVGVALLGVLTNACAQTQRIRPALGDTVVIGMTDTAAHLYRELWFGPDYPIRRVIREQRDLDEFWSTLQTHIPPPTVDFSQKDVLAVGFGRYPTLGPTISIDTVLTRGSERIVVVGVRDLIGNCLVPSAVSAPFDIVVVPRDSTRTTQFAERRMRLTDCHPSPDPIRR